MALALWVDNRFNRPGFELASFKGKGLKPLLWVLIVAIHIGILYVGNTNTSSFTISSCSKPYRFEMVTIPSDPVLQPVALANPSPSVVTRNPVLATPKSRVFKQKLKNLPKPALSLSPPMSKEAKPLVPVNQPTMASAVITPAIGAEGLADQKSHTIPVQTVNRPSGAAFSEASISRGQIADIARYYPESAVERGLQGKVYLRVKVTEKGRAEAVTVLSSAHPILGQAARQAAHRAFYVPARRDGQAIASSLEFSVNYLLENG